MNIYFSQLKNSPLNSDILKGKDLRSMDFDDTMDIAELRSEDCTRTFTPSVQVHPQQTNRLRLAEIPRSTAISFCVFLSAFLAYSLSASYFLEDYDSINFAMAVNKFDLSMDAPHPPGAPIYIAFIKWLHWVVSDITLLLTLSSALGGALFVTLWHKIFQCFLTVKNASISTAILAFSPGLWMTASRPMSDTFAAAALSTCILLALQYTKNRHTQQLMWFGAVLALMVGIRPQFGLFAPILLFSTLFYFRPTKITSIKTVAAFTLVNLCWLLPTIASQYNLDGSGWMTYFNQITRFKISFNTASGSPLLVDDLHIFDVISTAATHIGTLGYFALGLNLWYPESAAVLLERFGTTLNPWPRENLEWTYLGSLYTVVYILGTLLLLPHIRYYWKKLKNTSSPAPYLLLVAVAYSITVIMFVPPHARFYLPLLPLFILLPVLGLRSRKWGHTFQYALMATAVTASLHTIIDSISYEAPPIALVKEIQRQTNTSGNNTILLLDSNAARHASWYLPQAKVYGGHEEQAPASPYGLFKEGTRVFSNYPEAFSAQRVKAEKLQSYHRPYRVWMRHTSTQLYELTLRHKPLAAMAARVKASAVNKVKAKPVKTKTTPLAIALTVGDTAKH